MIVLGVDAHKQTHTVAAVDQAGRLLGHVTVAATSAGHLRALTWAEQFGVDRRWAVEDCRHLSRLLEAELVGAGEAVVRVPPRLMGASRRGLRQRGKSDPIDARAAAAALLAEPDLPAARLDGAERELRLLVDHRENLARHRTAVQNRLRWRLHELAPGEEPPAGTLDRMRVLDRLERYLAGVPGPVARVAAELVADCRELTRRANALEREIAERVAQLAPSLLALPGCGALTAAKIVGETAGIDRFTHKDAYAMHNGTAPIPVWTGNRERVRLNRGGNRQLNAALHRIAVTQIRTHQPAIDYLHRRRHQHADTTTEALRALRRQLSNEVYKSLRADHHAQTDPTPCLATAA